MSTQTTLLQRLADLQHVDYDTDEASRRSNLKVERVLEAVWQAGRRRSGFDYDRDWKAKILLISVAVPIRMHIERLACQFRTSLDDATLRKRSAIQFLIDDYKLASEFSESAQLLDQIIHRLRDADLSDSDGPRVESDHKHIPDSHTWWRN